MAWDAHCLHPLLHGRRHFDHGQILQLTSLLPTAEHFSILLRDALKSQVSQPFILHVSELTQLQLAAMKKLKPFLPSLYSEYLLATPASSTAPGGGGNTDHLLLGTELGGEKSAANDGEGDLRGPGGDGRGEYQRGLGETFGFPGDARKMRERSKMKLWREYFTGELEPHRSPGPERTPVPVAC